MDKPTTKALSANFEMWMVQEVAKLEQRRQEVSVDFDIESVGALYMQSHDLKGLAPTLGYPLVQEAAASLCELIDFDGVPFETRLALVDDYIDAICALVRRSLKDQQDPIGRALLEPLQADLEILLRG